MTAVDEDDEQGEECGCDWVGSIEVDGRTVEVHHTWPDDGAPHAATSECGCGPQLSHTTDALWLYDHVDQDPITYDD